MLAFKPILIIHLRVSGSSMHVRLVKYVSGISCINHSWEKYNSEEITFQLHLDCFCGCTCK